MPVPTIEWRGGHVKILDQTKLPNRLEFIHCKEIKSLWKAIRNLQVRGAPALGVAGALGVVLGIKDSKARTYPNFERELRGVVKYLGTSRPTAVNLFWALGRMEQKARENKGCRVPRLKKILLKEALKIMEEDKSACRRMAKFAAKLLKDGDVVLTHCNAGALATADYGTALGAIYRAKEEGKRIKVYADETRPLLQGARLTTWELMKEGIDVTLVCDNMAADLMRQGKISKVLVGADRIASNGDVANKIGTYNLAVLAKYHKIPFFVIAPLSSIDLSIKTGSQIPIEQRDKSEVIEWGGRRIAPRKVGVYNPAFDVTPAKLVRAIVTEKGIFRPPYRQSLGKLMANK